MARYKGNDIRETNELLKLLARKNQRLLKQVQSGLPRVMLNAGQILQARAQEIIQEKGHVVTGNLVRSIATQLITAEETRVEVAVGTHVLYAPFVEALPDGGFLYEASVQTFNQVTEFIVKNGLEPHQVQWGQ